MIKNLGHYIIPEVFHHKLRDWQDMDINKIVEDVKGILTRTDFMISWYAKKYNKTIFRAGNMSHVGCRVWERNGDKYICFFDPIINRYTTAINPMITYKRKVN